MRELRISAVSYLNARPFVYGIENSGILESYDLHIDNPVVCADKLLSNEVDIGLIPVAVLPEMEEYHILTNYCIGCDGPVGSVVLFSEVPLEQIRRIYLDYQSRTSVLLVQLLSREFWKTEPEWLDTSRDYESKIGGNTAGLVIGDRSFSLKQKFPCQYDLGEEWKKYTGLPFVFACWVANKVLPEEVVDSFSRAIEFGMQNKEKLIDELRTNQDIDIAAYLNEHIDYDFDVEKHKSLDLFLEKSRSYFEKII